MLVRLLGHPAVERGPKVRVPHQVLVGRHAVREHEAGPTGHNRLAQPTPRLPRVRCTYIECPISNRIRSLAAQCPTEWSQRKAPIRLLVEDSGADQYSQKAVQ